MLGRGGRLVNEVEDVACTRDPRPAAR